MDSHYITHPNLKETPTHADRSAQIDYCFVSPDIIQHVKRCGITALHYAIQGADHRTIWIDIDAEAVLGGKMKAPVGVPSRGLKLKNVNALKRFKEHLTEYIKQHRMEEKIRRFLQD